MSAHGLIHRGDEYRPDIDGLRALAVLLVVLFHASPFAPAGFLGVDVFFVISGYLISGIIIRETSAGTFTLQNFYARRCRRILPALVVVLAATWVIGKIAFTEDHFHLVGKHILGGATFTSNFILWGEAGYFDFAAARKPLLHLWSLAVEEQFYLVWPPLLMLAVTRRYKPLALTATVAGASLAAVIFVTPRDEAAAFYLLPFRMWELLAGAALVQLEWRARSRDGPPRANLGSPDFRAVVGVLMVIGASILDPDDSDARVLWLLAAVVGATLLISARGSRINQYILGNKVMVGIGLISYPLYLWHWPLLSAVKLLSGPTTVVERGFLNGAVVALSFVLAWGTWRLVEQPVQRFAAAPLPERRRRNRLVLGLSASALLMTSLLGWRVWDRSGLVRSVRIVNGEPFRNVDYLFPRGQFRRISGADSVVALVGDSHADALRKGLAPELWKRGFGLSHVGSTGCLGVPLEVRLWESNRHFRACQKLANATVSYLVRDTTVKYIFFVARGTLYSTGIDDDEAPGGIDDMGIPRETRLRVLNEAYSDAIRRFEKAGKRLVLFHQVPELDFDPDYCNNRLLRPASAEHPCAVRRDWSERRQGDFRELVQGLQRQHPTLVVFDPYSALCDSLWCYAERKGVLMYGDRHHLSPEGGRLLAESIEKVVFQQIKEERPPVSERSSLDP